MTEKHMIAWKNKDTKDQIMQGLGLLLFGLFLVIRQRHMDFSTCDDPWFYQQLQEQTLGEFLRFRYENWTSRLIIETLLVLVVRLSPWVWRICNTAFILCIAYGMSRIALPKGKRKWTWIACVLLLFTPTNILHSAGYAATSLNYIWPLGAGMITLIPIADDYRGEKTGRGMLVAGVVLSLLATNQEQMAAILAGVAICIVIDGVIQRKKPNWYTILILVIAILQMILVLVCPGNDVRVKTEIIAHFPDFSRISVWSKVQIGFLSETAYYFGIAEKNNILLPLLLVMAYVLIRRKKYLILCLEAVATVPVLFLGYANQWLVERGFAGAGIEVFRNIRPMIFAYEYSKEQVWTEMIVYACCCVLLAVCIYVAAGGAKRGMVVALVPIAGFLSRFIIGFSASVYVSGYRTSLFATVSFFLTAMLILAPYLPNEKFSDSNKQTDGMHIL